MEDLFSVLSNSLSVVAGLTGLVSVSTTIVSMYLSRRSKTSALKNAEEKEFQAAIQSSNLKTLGDYLYKGIGEIRVGDFSSDPKVRERVTDLVERLDEFLREPEDKDKSEKPEFEQKGSIEYVQHDPDLIEARSQLESGNLWNGLAGLRRVIESRLKDLAIRRGFKLGRVGAGRVLGILWKKEMIPPDVARNLQYAITVANKGVHGEDVTADEALEAFLHAEHALQILDEFTG